jgi:hypothetical protein
MKYFFAVATLLFFSTCTGQKPFEGTIVYRLHASDKNDDGQLTVLFGKNGVKLKMTDKNGEEKEQLLIRIDSGKLITLDTEEKTFRTKNLKEKEKKNTDLAGKNIAGFSARAIDVSPDDSPVNGLLGSFFRTGTATMYVSDSLFYFIPDKYISNVELAFVRNNQIALGLILRVQSRLSEFSDKPANDSDNETKMEISVEAVSVKWENFKEDEFSVPADFVKSSPSMPMNDYGVGVDSIAIADSSPKIVPQKKPAIKSSPKTKQPIKPKTKTSTTQQGAIRKPE